MKLLLVVFVLGLCSATYAKVFTRCGLAVELVNKGIPRAQINDWVCLVESESSRNTAAVGPPNSNGSRDYGLFQINDYYWCKHGSKGGDCNVECNQLLTDDITVATTCAKLIYARHGFNAWYGWIAKCKGTKPDVSSCFG